MNALSVWRIATLIAFAAPSFLSPLPAALLEGDTADEQGVVYHEGGPPLDRNGCHLDDDGYYHCH